MNERVIQVELQRIMKQLPNGGTIVLPPGNIEFVQSAAPVSEWALWNDFEWDEE